jgi:A/G-specific adenine glycosylase
MSASGGEITGGAPRPWAGFVPAARPSATLAAQTSIGDWYDANRRDLPWRAADRTPWGVLVSEVMLQQTPVARVLPAWSAWMTRWPQPADLAGDSPGEAVRQWDRLGYPRRALNLHAAAVAIVERHGGSVPDQEVDLRALPGVGEYTAAAVRAFAFGRRSVVLDTNVRRVLARLVDGQEHPVPSLTVSERARAEALVPGEAAAAAHWSVAVMELGALVCTATSPSCPTCPVVGRCAWVRAGRPAYDGPARRVQQFAGTDRQVRGRIMAVLRESSGSVARPAIEAVWEDALQRERALDGLVADGLVELVGDDGYGLPTGR